MKYGQRRVLLCCLKPQPAHSPSPHRRVHTSAAVIQLHTHSRGSAETHALLSASIPALEPSSQGPEPV